MEEIKQIGDSEWNTLEMTKGLLKGSFGVRTTDDSFVWLNRLEVGEVVSYLKQEESTRDALIKYDMKENALLGLSEEDQRRISTKNVDEYLKKLKTKK